MHATHRHRLEAKYGSLVPAVPHWQGTMPFSYPVVFVLLMLGSGSSSTAGSSGPGAQEHRVWDGGLQEGCQTRQKAR